MVQLQQPDPDRVCGLVAPQSRVSCQAPKYGFYDDELADMVCVNDTRLGSPERVGAPLETRLGYVSPCTEADLLEDEDREQRFELRLCRTAVDWGLVARENSRENSADWKDRIVDGEGDNSEWAFHTGGRASSFRLYEVRVRNDVAHQEWAA